ncbi:DeoR/GlpR family DNA-binding transcription regulator [Anaerosinus massiliensis]|uniref:DeoR/GlpR family DNA-binding transcription regulator n=1 Tax=Massilibacillus massiliensis TaxID=1806837 RepID=UPI000DA6263E|nr:DeoR/GlpR family DNA-binding transcription regulator [Massilibacillus massiliensis]
MKINRIEKIEDFLKFEKTASWDKLCETFGVSKNTLRRDVNELEKRGFIKRVYGGIMLKETDVPEPFESREIKHKSQKKIVAKLANDLINDGDVIYIDSGTTTMHLVPFLESHSGLTVITSNLYVINAARDYPKLNILSPGGVFYPPSNAFVGPSILRFLEDYTISKTFFASTGVSIDKGVANASPLEAEIKSYLIKKSCKNILLVDSSKIDGASLMKYCDLKDLDYFVTDQMPPDKYISYFNEHHIQLVTK